MPIIIKDKKSFFEVVLSPNLKYYIVTDISNDFYYRVSQKYLDDFLKMGVASK